MSEQLDLMGLIGNSDDAVRVRSCRGCGASLLGLRSTARWCSEACRKRATRALERNENHRGGSSSDVAVLTSMVFALRAELEWMRLRCEAMKVTATQQRDAVKAAASEARREARRLERAKARRLASARVAPVMDPERHQRELDAAYARGRRDGETGARAAERKRVESYRPPRPTRAKRRAS
jgi:hypothetical protein